MRRGGGGAQASAEQQALQCCVYSVQVHLFALDVFSFDGLLAAKEFLRTRNKVHLPFLRTMSANFITRILLNASLTHASP